MMGVGCLAGNEQDIANILPRARFSGTRAMNFNNELSRPLSPSFVHSLYFTAFPGFVN